MSKSETQRESSSDKVIDVRSLTIRFGSFTAVNRVSFTVSPGEVFGMLGPNGSGKTTVIRALCGLLPFAEGSACVLGQDVSKDADAIRVKLGYMSQKFSLYEDLTATENMDFYTGIYGLTPATARQRKAELTELTGLGPYLDRRAGKLSGGTKQRLALVLRAFAPAATGLSRRTDRRHRPRGSPRPVGPAVPPRRRGHHAVRHHSLHG